MSAEPFPASLMILNLIEYWTFSTVKVNVEVWELSED
jgi:hypothetical protein